MRAIIYSRVSTSRQESEGYSLRQQVEALREYARAEGYEVVEEVQDADFSGSTLERPGLDRVRDLVESGAADVVLAQDADRVSREPGDRAHLDVEFERQGAKIVALDDWDSDSPEGELLRFIKGWSAKQERLRFRERSRRGTQRKVREGRVVGSGPAKYGFRYAVNAEGKTVGFVVDEPAMAVVQRIFSELAHGSSVNGVARGLDRDGVPTPTSHRGDGESRPAATSWSRAQVRNLVADPAYEPHTVEQIRGWVSDAVLAGLDPEEVFGLWHYNRRSLKHWNERDGEGEYRRRWRTEHKAETEWLSAPVPWSGVPAEEVMAAREALRGRQKSSAAGGRDWELSGGALRCASCGGTMGARTSRSRKGGSVRFYYICRKAHTNGGCKARTNHRAEPLEREVLVAVDDLLSDPERAVEHLDAAIRAQERNLRDPGQREAALTERLSDLARQRTANQEMYRASAMTLAELQAENTRLDAERESAEGELAGLRSRSVEVEALRAHRENVLEAFGMGLQLGLEWFPAELRRQLYSALALRVVVDLDGGLALEGDLDRGVLRYTAELEAFVEALREADERVAALPAGEGYVTTLPNPDGSEAVLHVSAEQARGEQVERELERARGEATRVSSEEISGRRGARA